MPATTTPSPLFFEVAAVYHTQNRVVIRHRYAKGYRAEMSIADLARAAGKLDVSAEPCPPFVQALRPTYGLDVYRWELYSRLKRRDSHDGSELPVVAGCWDTLTEFVREAAERGCHLSDGTIYVGNE